MERGSIKRRILAAVKANPGAKNVEIAKMVEAHPAYVSAVLQREGLAKFRFSLGDANAAWVRENCAANGATISEFVNACLTDARLDDEERRAA